MPGQPLYCFFPLGDSAITLDFGNIVDEKINNRVIALFHSLQENPLPGMIELIPAYSSLTVYYDLFLLRKSVPPEMTVSEWMIIELEKRAGLDIKEAASSLRLMKIPVCYEKDFGPDTEEITTTKKISADELMLIHTSKIYRVFMLGFLPGFAYMGPIDAAIEMPRKLQPRQRVEAGSVGIAGTQTGIYPLASPGGWQIIGRTPVRLFDATKEEPTLLKAGDTVQFYPISKNEFESY